MESEIRETLSSYRSYMAEWYLLATYAAENRLQPTAEVEKRSAFFEASVKTY